MSRSAASALEHLAPEQRRLLRPADPEPGPPMLAVPSGGRTPPADGWLYERKLDGVRLVAVRQGERVRLLSRTGRPMTDTFPEVAEALRHQPCQDFAVDGELVAMRDGRTDFGLLQQRSGLSRAAAVRASRVTVSYYVFDLVRLAGQDLAELPLHVRKELLGQVLDFGPPLHLTTHRQGDAAGLLAAACAQGWEGLVAKRADAPYRHRRSGDWLKLKCQAGQEFVIGGFTEPSGSRVGFGALLLGYYQDGLLRYAGKVGTGWSAAELRVLRAGLDRIEQPAPPFRDPPRERAVHWVRPVLVAQIGFTEWTREGRLRAPRFVGLRDDKAPHEVVREQ
ncbi:non-homologous end-joining DNA ligase [Kitasatospora sp. NPDC058965]|uniref:non-homologous end-joining DNA ligase n=1 Tax=Kitasatospora sp. NPDC058965 TaxID=3346682 RepID=UPI0036757934